MNIQPLRTLGAGLWTLSLMTIALPATAVPVFDNYSGTVATGDVNWQTTATTAGGVLSEQDFESFINGADISNFTIGGITVSISYPSSAATTGEIFAGSFGSNAGMVAGNALLNRDSAGSAADTSITFSFSGGTVIGFGTWVFDNNSSTMESFSLTANGVTSSDIDANPGSTNHTVDGFLGVVDTAGLSSVTVNMNTLGGLFFELDHMQIAVQSNVSEPATLSLLGLGIAAMGLRRRRRVQ